MKTRSIILAAASVTSMLVAIGRIIHGPAGAASEGGIAAADVGWICFYAVFAGIGAVWVTELALAAGHLPSRIRAARRLALLLVVVSAISAFRLLDSVMLLVASAGAGIVVSAAGVIEVRRNRHRVTDILGEHGRPASGRPRPVASVLEAIFRLFPAPVPVGLYRLGSPSAMSPVIVTGNYDVTVRRVFRALRSTDCLVLVCDSRGTNVWCASLAGRFTSDSVVREIERCGLADHVDHRVLVLPQLAAGGISVETIRRMTGFECRFGPIGIEYLETFISGDPVPRHASFPLRARIEMAVGAPITTALILVLVYNAIGPHRLFVYIPGLYLFSILQAVFFARRPIRDVRLWAVCIGATLFLLLRFGLHSLLPGSADAYILSFAAMYVVCEFQGWSPVEKFSAFTRYVVPMISIDDTCNRCGMCIDVCPKGVFALGAEKVEPAGLKRCISCRSCFTQCPADAIVHSANTAAHR